MISIITATYNTPPEILERTWASIKAQTYTNWEWIIWDDSTTDDVWNQVLGFMSDDRYKIRLYKSSKHSGIIGEVKRNAFMVAYGHVGVELDHDDELTPNALDRIQHEFMMNPTVGFIYSDWCEILPSGESGRYPQGWAFGYGSEYWNGEVWVMSAPEVNATTMSHIVSAPNHIRAWRMDVYRIIGGHNPMLQIADDYELVVRTWLVTDFLHIPELLYIQHIGQHTAQRQKNDLIQELVGEISRYYEDQINSR